MKAARTHPKKSIISVRGLVFIYLLLCVLMVIFSRSFFLETFNEGQAPGRLTLIVFFTIPIVLIVFFAFSAFDLFVDLVTRRSGGKFKARLLGYFFLIVVFSAVPGIIVTGLSMNEIYHYWKTINASKALAASRGFAVDTYSLSMEKFEAVIDAANFSEIFSEPGRTLPQGISSAQEFRADADGTWTETAFIGGDEHRLKEPPAVQQGYIPRTLPRDAGVIRYVSRPARNILRVLSYGLGDEFDSNTTHIEELGAKIETIDSIMGNIRPLLILYYGVFFFPTLVMTLIIAISFTRRVTYPITELTEAIRRVAEGDFSIQILAHRGDELGVLIRSFNAMVQDLEKSRTALLKAEKISIWQNMAQQLAHEIKNPLTPIKLSAERILRRWHTNPEKIGEILEDSILAIIQETEGLSALLNEFRTLSRPMEPSESSANLNKAIEEILNLYRNSYPAIEFLTEYIQSSITVKMDKHRLAQVLTNIILNAVDAVNNGRRTPDDIGRAPDDEGHTPDNIARAPDDIARTPDNIGRAPDNIARIEIRADTVKKREIQYCRLSIKDNGKGISKQDGQHIFTPYFTTKNSGTGLGLPIVERIINDHGGSIWYNSAEGMGTTFFIDLPVDTPQAGSENPAAADTEQPPGDSPAAEAEKK